MYYKNFTFKKQIRGAAIALVVLLFSFSLVGCDQIAALFNLKKIGLKRQPSARVVRGTVVAKVNNYPITLEDLNEDINVFNQMVPADKPEEKKTTREQKVDYLKNEMVRRMLLYQEALNQGLDSNETIVRALEKAKIELCVVELVRQEAGKVEASSKEVEDYYNTYKEQLKEPEERQVREILVPSEQEARDILIQLLQGADFATLAKDKSKSASAKVGGDLGFIPKGKKSAQFDQVAFSDTLDVGKISNIFKGPDGYYLIKLEAKRGGKLKPLSEMWEDIKRVLTFLKQQQRIENIINKLSREAKIEIYEGEIK